jgi:hypothetical protein
MSRCFTGLLLAGICLAQSAPEATLSGHITDAATHQPIEGAQITVRGLPLGKPASAVSDASGAYSVRITSAPRADVEISKSGYSSLSLASSDRTLIRLKPGDPETRDFELSKPARITGRLIDRDSGKPLSGFYIHAIRWYAGLENSTGFRYPAAPTSADGSFSLPSLPPASYVLVVDPPMAGKIRVPVKGDPKDEDRKDETGYSPAWYPGVPRPEMAAPIALGYAENRRIEMRLQKHELLHIAGTVRLPEGAEGGSISFTVATEEKGRPTGAEGSIASAGPFRIDGLEQGTYRILAWTRLKSGKTSVFASRLAALTSQSVEDLSLDLKPGVALQVIVKMDDEKAEPPKRFNFVPLSAEGWGPLDEGGPGGAPNLNRTGLPPGRYNIALMQMPGYAVASTTLNGTPIPPGDSVDLESPESVLVFVLTTQLGSVTGAVRDADQQPVPDAEVTIAPEAFLSSTEDRLSLPPGAGETTTSDATGHFAFSGLAPGRYRAFATPADERRRLPDAAAIRERMRNAKAIEVSAQKTANIDLAVGK